MSKPRQKASRTKLKTMNQISAEEARRLCHAVIHRGDHALAFPKDIAAKDFLEWLKLYSEMLSRGVIDKRSPALSLDDFEPGSARAKRDVSEDSKNLTEKDLDELFCRAPQQRKIVDVIRRNKDRKMSLDEIAVELGGVNRPTKTVQNHLTIIFKKTKSKNLRELAHKLPPLPPRP
jgi:DNA-binding CsgD family transcriptional regulator